MLQLKGAFQELVPKHFNFLKKRYGFKFEGFEFDKGYAFLYIADYSNELVKIHISFDEREGYLGVILWPKNDPKKRNSMYRLLEVINPQVNFELKVTQKKLETYRRFFKETIDEKTIESEVGQFVFNRNDLHNLLKQYAQALKKYYKEIMREMGVKN